MQSLRTPRQSSREASRPQAGPSSRRVTALAPPPDHIAIFPDNLGQCLDWAKRGWIFRNVVLSRRKREHQSASPAFATLIKWTSDGNPGFCMGEVTDVMALTDLLVNHASAHHAGRQGQNVPIKRTASFSCTAIRMAAASPTAPSNRARQ